MRRLRPLTEAECYARCYGGGDENVRVIRMPAPAPARRRVLKVSGEQLRRLFEERLEQRGPEVEAA
jgi:hypothetical protein